MLKKRTGIKCLGWIAIGLAQPVRAGELTLNQALALAQSHNPELRAARAEWGMAKADEAGSMSLPPPLAEVEVMEARSGRELRLSQEIPFPVKLALRKSAAAHLSRRAGEEFRITERHLTGEVKRAYLELRYQSQARKILEGARKEIRDALAGLRSRSALGRTMPTDQPKAEAEEADLDSMILMTKQDEEKARIELTRLIGDADKDPQALEDPVLRELPSGEDEILTEALQHSPEVMRETHHLVHARAELRAQRAEFIPDLMVEGYQRDFGGMAEKGAVAGLTLPFVWFWGSGSKVSRAAREREHAEALLQAAAVSTRAHARESWVMAAGSQERLQAFDGQFLPKAERAMKLSREQYEAGRSGFMEYLDSWRMLRDVRLRRARALADYGQGLAHLEELCRTGFLSTSASKQEVQP